jgi:hypothetical protein
MNLRTFTREPALILAVIQSILTLVVGFQLDWLTPEQAALWMVVFNAIAGAIAAWLTRPIAPTVYTHLFTVVATLLAAYGLDLSQELLAGLNALAVSVLMLLSRGQVSPAGTAHQTGVLGNKVTTGGNPGKQTY